MIHQVDVCQDTIDELVGLVKEAFPKTAETERSAAEITHFCLGVAMSRMEMIIDNNKEKNS